MASEAVAAPTTPSKQDRDVAVEAMNHLIQGKRHLLVQDVPSAVNSLEEACKLLDACYGPMANECGDAYYHYGIALLESSRQETGILGNGKDAGSGSDSDEEKDDEDEDEDEDEEEDGDDDDDDSKTTGENDEMSGQEKMDTDQGEDNKKDIIAGMIDKKVIENERQSEAEPKLDSEAKSEDLEASQKADEGIGEEKPQQAEEPSISSSSTVNEAEPVQSVAGPSTSSTVNASSSSDNNAEAGTSEGKKPKEEEDDEPSSLQLAWEVFEVAKVIFKRQSENNREMQLKLAQVYLKLGEVAMESENYQQSIEDLLECLSIQTNILPLDDRAIAETYYQLGLAYAFNSQFELSIGSFTDSIKVLENRISNLEKTLNETVSEEKNGEPDRREATKKEIEELKELIPEIRERILDTEESQKNSVNLPEALDKDVAPPVKPNIEEQVDSTTSPSQVKPVMNIGHLVRKKRKPEESEVSTSNSEGEPKRIRSELENEIATNEVTGSGDALSSSSNSCNVNLNGVTNTAITAVGDSGIDSTATNN